MLGPLLYGMIFLGVLLIVEGVYLFIYGGKLRREAKVNRRLRLLEQGADREEVMVKLRKERERHQNARGTPLFSIVFEKAEQGHVALAPRTIVMIMGAIAVVSFIIFSIATPAALLVRIVVALALGYASVFIWLRGRARMRLQQFEEQLPDAVDLIVRSLRIGHPLIAAVNIVAQEMADPLASEFGLIADEATYGMPITDSLDRLAARIDVPDLRFLAVAVNIQTQSGGNLAEILTGLSQVIRSRFKLSRKIRAITAEARWSGWFLSIFPIAALLLIQIVQPGYYDEVSNHPLFTPGVIAVFILIFVNLIFMHLMVRIRV